jgi:hypothetical protein
VCTIVVLRRPDTEWPVLIAANRDEMLNRPWAPPGRHWPDRPQIIAGLDRMAGGSWLGLNDQGVVAAALNREGSLGPAAGKRSRGELVLDALDHADAADAAAALSALDPRAYRPFNLVVADNRDAFLLALREGAGRIAVEPLPPGLTMLTSRDRNDPRSPRIRVYHPLFAAAKIPDPGAGDWSDWAALLGTRDSEPGAGAVESLFIDPLSPDDSGALFGTVSSSLLALPAAGRPDRHPIWRFASGQPENWRWLEVAPEPGS